MRIIAVLLTVFLASSIHAQTVAGASGDKLKGSWLRSDGSYAIEIIALEEGGNLSAKYFNPNPINVGKAGWRINNDETQIFVELRDTNYPGSMYRLSYIENSGMLTGTYYHPVSKQTYKVDFRKNE